MTWTDYAPDAAREAVRTWIGEALGDRGRALALEDYRIDTIVEAAARRDIAPALVRIWIFDFPTPAAWTAGNLIDWARQRGFFASTHAELEAAVHAASAAARGETARGGAAR